MKPEDLARAVAALPKAEIEKKFPFALAVHLELTRKSAGLAPGVLGEKHGVVAE